jgi:hypothetical protein
VRPAAERSGAYRCPRCLGVQYEIKASRGGLVVEVDRSRRRAVCRRDGADMRPLSEGDLAMVNSCTARGHPIEPWRGGCECGASRL